MRIRITFTVLLFLFTTLSINQLTAQTNADTTTSQLKLNISSDLVSRYIWRGTDFGGSPAIQPTLSLSFKNLEIGCWGSVATNSFYKEIDLYAKYSYKNLSFTFTDYYIPSVNGTAASPDIRYFAYKDKNTAHTFETSLLYKGGEKFPFWLMGGVFLYGNDKRWGVDLQKDTDEKTYYSSYIECGYTFAIHENSLDVFAGITPSAGAYGNKAGVVNVGVTGSRKVKLTDSFELPMKVSLIFNPQASTAFFVLGISI